MEQELLTVEQLIQQNQLDEAEKRLKNFHGNGANKADVEYLRGYVSERYSDFEEALDHYQAAIDADPHARRPMFRMARLLNQRGDDEDAVKLYERCVSAPPAPVRALVNLAILYEDQGRYEQSRRILDRIVKEHPNHSRARAFLGDVENSITMYHDDDTDRARHQRNAMMDMPVSEFELSVRARNCLKQMNINTIGDLLRITESQLLAFKNFGETSLGEIKRVLTSRGLRLGQLVEQAPVAAPAAPAPPPPPVGANPALLNRPVAEMELSVRSRKCLQRLGVNSIGELIQRSEPELLSIKNFGQTSLLEIKRRLTEMGLSLAVSNR